MTDEIEALTDSVYEALGLEFGYIVMSSHTPKSMGFIFRCSQYGSVKPLRVVAPSSLDEFMVMHKRSEELYGFKYEPKYGDWFYRACPVD